MTAFRRYWPALLALAFWTAAIVTIFGPDNVLWNRVNRLIVAMAVCVTVCAVVYAVFVTRLSAVERRGSALSRGVTSVFEAAGLPAPHLVDGQDREAG